MDQKKIGAFIAQCRKEKKLTQMQLAELLEITNQAVSKWETGKGMPDVSLLQPLCDILDISLNELFSGEHIPTEEYRGKAEENISKLFEERQFANLKSVKYLFSICAQFTLLIVIIELAVGFIGNIFSSSIFQPMLINAFVWFVLFVASFVKLMYDKNKLAKLKNTGLCMDAAIEELLPVAWIRVSNYTSCRVLYRFVYGDKEYRAKSSYYVLSPFKKKEDYFIKVYFNIDNPSQNSIELFQ